MFKKLLLAFAFVLAATAAHAQSFKRTTLQTTDVPGSNYVSVLALAEFPAGAMTGLHTHPGTEQGTLLEGELIVSIDGEADKVYKPGDSWTIAAGAPHDAKAGAAGAKVVVDYVVEKGKPMASAFKR